jgi:hypothetical protein
VPALLKLQQPWQSIAPSDWSGYSMTNRSAKTFASTPTNSQPTMRPGYAGGISYAILEETTARGMMCIIDAQKPPRLKCKSNLRTLSIYREESWRRFRRSASVIIIFRPITIHQTSVSRRKIEMRNLQGRASLACHHFLYLVGRLGCLIILAFF